MYKIDFFLFKTGLTGKKNNKIMKKEREKKLQPIDFIARKCINHIYFLSIVTDGKYAWS